MDDLIKSVDNTNIARKLKFQSEQLFAKAKFKLHKWKTNNPELRKEFGCNECKCKILGMIWDMDKDRRY